MGVLERVNPFGGKNQKGIRGVAFYGKERRVILRDGPVTLEEEMAGTRPTFGGLSWKREVINKGQTRGFGLESPML